MRLTACIAAGTLWLSACEPVPPRGPLVQASPTRTAAPAPSTATGTGTGTFDFEGEDRQDEEPEPTQEELDAIALHAKHLGMDPDELSPPEPRPAQPGLAAVAPVMGVPAPIWNADQPIDGSFGLRVLATLHDVQPPRAVVATADGQELVVQPGQMLPAHRLVVLAIGHGAVQVAHVTPQGFYARVQTETIATLAPSETRR